MAQTPWGDMRVSDAHVHFFSHRFFSTLAAQKKAENAEALGPLLGWDIPTASPEDLAARWTGEMDRNGIDRACLIASVPGDEESVAAAVTTHPDRFTGYFMVDPLKPDAVERVKAALAGNLRGICLFPAMHAYSIADPRLVEILQAATDHHAIVFVHCGALSVGVRKKVGLPSLFDMRYSNPMDLHPVTMHFPKTRFVIPHFGAGYFRETLMLADLAPNVYLDTSSSNRWMAYNPSDLDLRTVFRRAIEVVGLKRLLFGTDSSFFPRGWHADIFEQQAKALYEIGLSAQEAELVFHGNLTALLTD